MKNWPIAIVASVADLANYCLQIDGQMKYNRHQFEVERWNKTWNITIKSTFHQPTWDRLTWATLSVHNFFLMCYLFIPKLNSLIKAQYSISKTKSPVGRCRKYGPSNFVFQPMITFIGKHNSKSKLKKYSFHIFWSLCSLYVFRCDSISRFGVWE